MGRRNINEKGRVRERRIEGQGNRKSKGKIIVIQKGRKMDERRKGRMLGERKRKRDGKDENEEVWKRWKFGVMGSEKERGMEKKKKEEEEGLQRREGRRMSEGERRAKGKKG